MQTSRDDSLREILLVISRSRMEPVSCNKPMNGDLLVFGK